MEDPTPTPNRGNSPDLVSSPTLPDLGSSATLPESGPDEESIQSNLDNLNADVVLEIASYLNAKDLQRFSICCKNVFDICEEDNKIWKDVLKRETPEYWESFTEVAANLLDKRTQNQTRNVSKLALIVFNRTEANWNSSNPNVKEVPNIGSRAELVFDFSHRLLIKNWFVQFYDWKNVDFTIWDGTNGTTKYLTGKLDIKKHDREINFQLALFNHTIICYIYQSHFIGLKIDMKKGTLEEKWRLEPRSEFVYSTVFESYFVVVSKLSEKFLVEGFSTDSGSQLFSLETAELFRSLPCAKKWRKQSNDWNFAGDNHGWFVCKADDCLFAMNYNRDKKLEKIELKITPGVTLLLKHGYLLCENYELEGSHLCENYEREFQKLELFDLEKKTLIFTMKTDVYDIVDSHFDVRFKTIMAVLAEEYPSCHYWVTIFHQYQERSEHDFDFYDDDPDEQPKLRFMLNHMVKVERIPKRKYKLSLTDLKDKEERALLVGRGRAKIHQVHPFWIVLSTSRGFRVLDFLKVGEYLNN